MLAANPCQLFLDPSKFKVRTQIILKNNSTQQKFRGFWDFVHQFCWFRYSFIPLFIRLLFIRLSLFVYCLSFSCLFHKIYPADRDDLIYVYIPDLRQYQRHRDEPVPTAPTGTYLLYQMSRDLSVLYVLYPWKHYLSNQNQTDQTLNKSK